MVRATKNDQTVFIHRFYDFYYESGGLLCVVWLYILIGMLQYTFLSS